MMASSPLHPPPGAPAAAAARGQVWRGRDRGAAALLWSGLWADAQPGTAGWSCQGQALVLLAAPPLFGPPFLGDRSMLGMQCCPASPAPHIPSLLSC